MKAASELPHDPLFEQLRRHKKEHEVTMKTLVEQGFRKVLEESDKQPTFKLRDGSVNGQGLTQEFSDASWTKIRDASYQEPNA